MLKMLRIFGLVAISLVVASSNVAVADPWKDESGKGWKQKHGKYKKNKKYKFKEEYKRGKGGYKYERDDGNCKYEYKEDKHGYKEERNCKGGNRAAGGPPPWAPAHGYRGTHPRDRRGGTRTAYVAPFDLNRGHCDRSALGTVLGAATGGAVGSTIGRGDGRTAAIIGGTILGALVGGSIGRSMDQVDQNCVGQALEHAPDGNAITWNTDGSRARHQVTPVKTYQDTRGRYCREYQTTSVVGGRRRRSYGTACRQPDGSWRLID